jgi:hypothetical protein
VFLNLEARTVSFYKNGTRIGVAAGVEVLTAREYFPAISLYELGQTVIALAPPPPVAAAAPAAAVAALAGDAAAGVAMGLLDGV